MSEGDSDTIDRPRVNADLVKDAEEMIAQARAIPDEEPKASFRRARLYRAAAHSLLTLAELTEIPLVGKCAPCRGTGRRGEIECGLCFGTGWLVTP